MLFDCSILYGRVSLQDLIYRDDILYSGTLESLISLMVPSVDYYPDKKFLFAFLLTSRLFLEPHDLLKTVVSMCDSHYNFSCKTPLNKVCIIIYISLCTFRTFDSTI